MDNPADWPRLSEAIVLTIGRVPFDHPGPEALARLTRRFGADEAARLHREVEAMIDVFFLSQAYRVSKDLAEVGGLAAAEFKARYPAVSEAALAALRNRYTYDWK